MTSSPTEHEAGEKDQVRPKSDFSIDHILNRAGNSADTRKSFENSGLNVMPFPWLHCTRYCPPKVTRNQRKEGPQRRQLGRHPRIPFTSQQLVVLEERFRQTPYLSSAEVTKISRSLQLADIRVKIWFQNRRARERRERAQLDNERKLFPNSPNVTSITSPECPSVTQTTCVLETVEENASDNKANPLMVTPIFPLLRNCPATFENVQTSQLLLSFPKQFINDSS